MNYWLMKSEPDEYGIVELKRDGTSLWEGIRNYQVRNFFRDDMKVGDSALFYHSNTKVPGVVGEMEVVKEAEPDPFQFKPNSKYYDTKSDKNNPRWLAVTVKFRVQYKEVIPLDTLKTLPALVQSPLVQKGNRLSVVPLTKTEYQAIQKLATIAK